MLIVESLSQISCRGDHKLNGARRLGFVCTARRGVDLRGSIGPPCWPQVAATGPDPWPTPRPAHPKPPQSFSEKKCTNDKLISGKAYSPLDSPLILKEIPSAHIRFGWFVWSFVGGASSSYGEGPGASD